MAEENGWRRCNECRSMVELSYGCHHMTHVCHCQSCSRRVLTLSRRCRCGHEFCYLCGNRWRTCQCIIFDEDMLYQRAQQVAVRPRNRPLNLQRDAPFQLPNAEVAVPAMREYQQPAAAQFREQMRDRAPRGNPQPRPRDPAAIQHADALVPCLRRTGAEQRNVHARRRAGHAAANVDDIAAHLRENHECAHAPRWRLFHHGVNQCEICQRVNPPRIGECPWCFLQACYNCRRHRMRRQ